MNASFHMDSHTNAFPSFAQPVKIIAYIINPGDVTFATHSLNRPLSPFIHSLHACRVLVDFGAILPAGLI